MKKKQRNTVISLILGGVLVTVLSACGTLDDMFGTSYTKAEDAKFLQLVQRSGVTSELEDKELLSIGHDIDWNLPREAGADEKELLGQIQNDATGVSSKEAHLIMSAAKAAYGLEEF